MAKQLLGKEVTAAMNQRLQERVAALKEKGYPPSWPSSAVGKIHPTWPMKRVPRAGPLSSG